MATSHASDAPSSSTIALRTVTASQFLDEQDRGPEWLVDGIMPRSGVAILVGEPKTYKTMLAVQLAISIASGRGEVAGRSTMSGGVLLVELEGGSDGLRSRLRRQLEHLGVPPPDNLRLAHRESVRLDTDIGRARLLAAIQRHLPALLILDPLMFLHAGDENRAADMASVMGWLVEQSRTFDLAVLVVHHTGKPQDVRRGLGERVRPRGSGVLDAAVDARISMVRAGSRLVTLEAVHRDAEPTRFHLEFDPDSLLLMPTDDPVAVAKIAPVALLAFVDQGGEVSVDDVRRHFRVAKNTAASALDRAEQAGELIKRRQGRRFVFTRQVAVKGQ